MHANSANLPRKSGAAGLARSHITRMCSELGSAHTLQLCMQPPSMLANVMSLASRGYGKTPLPSESCSGP